MTLLPETYEEDTIERMLPRETGYTLPWAMWADSNRVLWINGNYPIYKEPFGTSHMLIQRTPTGVIVYQATIKDHKYNAGDSQWNNSPHKLPVEGLK